MLIFFLGVFLQCSEFVNKNNRHSNNLENLSNINELNKHTKIKDTLLLPIFVFYSFVCYDGQSRFGNVFMQLYQIK